MQNEGDVCLESLSEKFEKNITNDRSDRGDFEIRSRKNVFDYPSYAILLPHARAFKFSH